VIEKGAKIYLETSVPSGYGRLVFHRPLEAFLDFIRKGDYIVIVSEHTIYELEKGYTPQEVFESLKTF